MSGEITFHQCQADAEALEAHLRACDLDFDVPLSQRVDIGEYARRLAEKAERIEAWQDGQLVGLVAAYPNSAPSSAFITNVSVLGAVRGRGLAERLVREALSRLGDLGSPRVELEVSRGAAPAIALYR